MTTRLCGESTRPREPTPSFGDNDPHAVDAALAATRAVTGPACRIDLFAASHPHTDHIGSAVAVIRAWRVANV